MDDRHFDDLTRKLATGVSRRTVLKGAAAGLLAVLGLGAQRHGTEAQVSQAQCGNRFCKQDRGVCPTGCVCCVYGNGNSRCRPAGSCGPGTPTCPPGQVLDLFGRCVASSTTTTTSTTTFVPTTTTTTAAPSTTTTTAAPSSTTTTTTAGPSATTTTLPPTVTSTTTSPPGCPAERVCGTACLGDGEFCCAGTEPCNGECCRNQFCIPQGSPIGCGPGEECPDDRKCGDGCLEEGESCCKGTTPCPIGQCCVDGCTSAANICCGATSCPFQLCCGNRCLELGEQCCGGTVCPTGRCCGNTCLTTGQECCGGTTPCASGNCCGGTCLPAGQECCGGTTPCATGRCCRGTCLAAGATCCQNLCNGQCLDGTGIPCCRGGGTEVVCSNGFCCPGIDLCLDNSVSDFTFCCGTGLCVGVCCPDGVSCRTDISNCPAG